MNSTDASTNESSTAGVPQAANSLASGQTSARAVTTRRGWVWWLLLTTALLGLVALTLHAYLLQQQVLINQQLAETQLTQLRVQVQQFTQQQQQNETHIATLRQQQEQEREQLQQTLSHLGAQAQSTTWSLQLDTATHAAYALARLSQDAAPLRQTLTSWLARLGQQDAAELKALRLALQRDLESLTNTTSVPAASLPAEARPLTAADFEALRIALTEVSRAEANPITSPSNPDPDKPSDTVGVMGAVTSTSTPTPGAATPPSTSSNQAGTGAAALASAREWSAKLWHWLTSHARTLVRIEPGADAQRQSTMRTAAHSLDAQSAALLIRTQLALAEAANAAQDATAVHRQLDEAQQLAQNLLPQAPTTQRFIVLLQSTRQRPATAPIPAPIHTWAALQALEQR